MPRQTAQSGTDVACFPATHAGGAYANEDAGCQLACDPGAARCGATLADSKKKHRKTLQTRHDCADHCAAAAQGVSPGEPFFNLGCEA